MIIISGPCQIESRDHCLKMAEHIAGISERIGQEIIFKSSFDKANRTSDASPRGVGLGAALVIFRSIREAFGLRIITDVHEPWQCDELSAVADVLQIPALLSRQTDLIRAAAQFAPIVNIKKGQFMAPADMEHAARKAADAEVWATERGTAFGYRDLVVDMRSFAAMRPYASAVIFDATHSVQTPAGLGSSSGGNRAMIQPLALAAMAAGADGLFIETHDDPDHALSDGPCMLPVDRLEDLLRRAMDVRHTVWASSAA